ncbi:MAG TPA: hypothetical protein VLE02_01595 [Nitrosarchaeum sp.]|nr:hypothetical protein [Nitrosarchaeum sp.]
MPNYLYATITVDTLLDSGHQSASVDASLGDINLTLEPTAFRGGRNYWLWRRDVSANVVTLIPNGADTVNGAASLVIAPGDKIHIIADPVVSDWVTMSF